MDIKHIVIQAGGKGSRMQALTRNRPKPLVPVRNLPIMFHLFRKFPDCKFTIIGDYKFDVMERYLEAFADVDYKLINGKGKVGTCGGLKEALSDVPENTPFMLIWGDLVLPENFDISDVEGCAVGLSKDFICRWKYENGVFSEEPSDEFGVAGLFLFDTPARLEDVPGEGEFVRWLSNSEIDFDTIDLYGTKEYGLYEVYKTLPAQKCRPFNTMRIEGDRLIKEGIDDQGRDLGKKEVAWYKKLKGQNFKNLPTIYDYEPLTMELIKGKNIYEYSDLDKKQKEHILGEIIDCLMKVHCQESCPPDHVSYYDAYIGKTYKRLAKVYELVPFAKNDTIVVNGEACPNPFKHRDEIEQCMEGYYPSSFQLIHGDCTFSNIMLKNDETPILIDPRGYFGATQFYGDSAYDWGKLYYSIVGNYDQFNLKRFDLDIRDNDVSLSIQSNGWEDMEESFFGMLSGEVDVRQMKMMHAIIWLSLTTYAWEDYDSICGAFYNGVRYLKEAL